MRDASNSREANDLRDLNNSPPSPILKDRVSMFLILLYMMGLATIVLIQIGLMHLSPKIFSTDVSILNNATRSLKHVFQYLTKYCTFVQWTFV
jgi:hypothetical protein